ncbi:unnamed protein product [Closterium sp. NIES-64]|nr:unnamed protein product [Closterium sp. NIES-64]
MATPSVLTFYAEGRAIDFEVWVDDLQLFLQCDRADGLSLFDLTSGASPAPAADADATVCSQWATCDAAARCASPPPYLRADHFLSVCPTTLNVDLLKKTLLAAEKSIVAVGASQGDLRTPIFEGRSVRRLPLAGDAALARARGARELEERAVEVEVEAVGVVGVAVGVEVGVGGSVAAVEAKAAAAVAVGAEVAEEAAVEAAAEAAAVAEAAEAVGVAVELVAGLRRGVAPRGGDFGPCTYVLRTGDRAGEQCGGPHSTQRCFGRLTDAWRHQIPEASEIPRWGELSRAGVVIFDDFDAILSLMYVVSNSDEGDCYRCFPPDPGIEAAALGACDAAALGASVSASSGTGESALSASPSGTLSGLYLPSFSTNLVSGADLQDAGVHQFTPARHRGTHCTEASTGRHLATFTRQPGSSLYTLTTASPPVAESGRVAASGQMFAATSWSGPESAPCSCRLLSYETLLWHHRLGHPSLLQLRGMASHLLVFGLPRSLPPLPQGPGPACVPCVKGRQRAAPHSSLFPSTQAPLQTLHMDVWGPARVCRQSHERYFLLVVDDYSRYTTVFPLRTKGGVTEVLIDWICAARLQLRQSFGSDFPVVRLHLDRGGEFSSGLLRAYCRARGIRQTYTLPDSPQQNGIAERRIGMVMDVARTSMKHAAAPHFLWPFAMSYAAHQINLHPRVSRPETSPALLWTGKFYHPTSRRVLSSQDVTFDESVPYYRLFPYRTPSLPPPPLFLIPGPPQVDPLPPQGLAPSGVSHVDAVKPVEVTGDSGAARGAEPGGAGPRGTESGGAEPRGAASWGAEPGGAELGGAASGGAETGGAEPRGAASWGAEPGGATPGGAERGGAPPGGSPGASSGREPLSPQELREWFDRRWRRFAGAGGSSVAEGAAVAGPGGARIESTGAAGPANSTRAGAAEGIGAETTTGGPAGGAPGAAGGSRAAGGSAGAVAPAEGTGAVPAASGVATRPRPYFVRLLQQSSLPALADPESDSLRAASPAVTRLFATVVTDPSFESTVASALSVCPPSVGGESALGTDVLEDRQEEFQCLAAASPHLVSIVLTSEGDPDALDIPTPRSYTEAIEGPYSSQWQAAMDAEMASWKSTGTYVDGVPPPEAHIVSGMWIFRVKRPPVSPPVFEARYVARGFSQR